MSHVLPVLVNELTAVSRPGVLVLDDHHVITNPDIDEQLTFLVEHLPATGMQIVLGTRRPATTGHAAVPARDSRQAEPVAQHRQNPQPTDLPQARRLHPRRRNHHSPQLRVALTQ